MEPNSLIVNPACQALSSAMSAIKLESIDYAQPLPNVEDRSSSVSFNSNLTNDYDWSGAYTEGDNYAYSQYLEPILPSPSIYSGCDYGSCQYQEQIVPMPPPAYMVDTPTTSNAYQYQSFEQGWYLKSYI